MASENALSTWDISVSQNVTKSSSEAEEIEIVHPDAPEDLNTARVKPELSEDTPPPSELQSSNIKNSLEISAVPKPNNLFEILIKKVESVNNSATEEVRSSTTENPKDQQTKNMNTKRAILTDPATNGNLSFTNGEASSENHEAENEKPNLSSHPRSIFDHLRKNFRILDESPRRTAEESSSKPDSLPTRPTCNNVTSSCAAKTKDVTMNQDADFPEERCSSSTAQVHMNSTTNDCSGFSVLESLNPSDNNHELNHSDDGEFPFTKRLRWISQRSREGSPSLPQQQQIPTEAEQESLDNISNSTSYFVETSNKTNAIASDSTRASVITAAHNSKPQGFQPLLNTSQSGSSNFGSISLRLQNGKTEMTQVSRVGAQSIETGQIPSNEAYLVLESKPSRPLEVNRSRISTNVPLKTQKENSRNLLAEKAQFHLLSENRQPSFSVLRSPPSLAGSSLFVNGVRGASEKNFINLNEQKVQFVNNEQRLQANQSHARQGSVDLSSTVYSKSPIYSKAFSPMWDHAVTSSIPIVNHRVPDSVPLCYGNGFSTASAFASHLYQPRSHGNPVRYGSQNPLFRSVQIQPRQGISFRPRFYQSPVVTTVPHAGQNLRSSTSEYMSKPPPPYTVNERLFRPVSPQWSQVLCTNNVCSATNSVAQVTKNEPTISDEDRDEFSYACALHESANSPDIERMLSSESPNENICLENLSSSNESSSKEPNVSVPKSSVQSLSSYRSTASGTARTRIYESPRSTCSEMARTSTSLTECSPKADFLASSQSCGEVVKEIKKESLETCKIRNSENLDISQNKPKENKANSTTEHQKRKMNLNVIHKRLKPKLPSPERETSSGDLYRDPSKLTREERALQRAMMQFSEMEMKEKVAPSLSKKKRVKESQTNKIKHIETQAVESKEKLASSTWLLKFKRKQRNWLTNRTKLVKKSSGFVKKISEEAPVKVEPQSSPDCNETEQNQNTKIKKRKKNAHDHDRTSKKHRKFTKKKNQNQMKEDFQETAAVEAKNTGDQDLDSQREEQAKKKKKFKKIIEKRRKIKEHDFTMTKQTKPDHVVDTDTLPSGTSNMPQSTTKKRKRSIDSSVERPHRIKTYMLVPSYQGFKDFQPVVMTSRTRNKKMVQPDDKDKSEDKPKVPLLVVESINSKPVKEMVVAESEEVQRLVTECLRVHGKWHGDELEQALKREEAKLNDEESKLRDAKRLTVNRTTGETILHKAARLGYDEVVRQCILRGADPNARDNAGWTPLHEACARGKLAVVRVLARYGANVNAPSNDGIRPIHDAAEAGHVNIIRVLLSYGADPVLATYAGNTALACAKDPKTRKFLREYCVDVGLDSPEYTQENTNGWDFTCSTRHLDNPYCSDHVSGIWEDIPSCNDSFVPEFEISDRPHLTTYNLPVLKDGVVVGRRNYLLVQEIYESGFIAKSTLQKKLKNIETREIPWSEFLETIAENHLCAKPSFSPEGSSKEEPKAELIPLNYTIRKLLGIRIESCKW